MQELAQGSYTRDQVKDILYAKQHARHVRFEYHLLDKNDGIKGQLNTVIDAEVSMKNLALIKRAARFSIKESDDISIDWLNDRIQPFIFFRSPSGEWLKWSLGIYLLSTPKRIERSSMVIREIEAYDLLQILADEKIDTRYTINQGKNYTEAVTDILYSSNIFKMNIETSDKVLNIDKEFDVGTSKLTIINTLLEEINYTSLWVDANGYFKAQNYILPSNRTKDYEYFNDDLSIIHNGIEEELDLFSVPNKFIVVKTNPETEPLMSIYTNDNPNSITSTISRGRIITDYREIDDIADQTALDDLTKRIAEEASNIYGHITFETALMPHHSYMDCLYLKHAAFNINDNFLETSWSMKLKAGAKMKHIVRKVVQV